MCKLLFFVCLFHALKTHNNNIVHSWNWYNEQSQCVRLQRLWWQRQGWYNGYLLQEIKLMWYSYKSAFVIPKLEFCIQAWRPYLQRDNIIVREGATRNSEIDIRLCHMKKDWRLHLTTLEARRIRGDLIESFTISKNLEDTNCDL